MNRSAFVALAALAAATVAQGAYAKSNEAVVVRNVVVHYGDLNLETVQGQASLRERIAQAAVQACGGNPVFSSSYRNAPVFLAHNFEQCRVNAVDKALSEVPQHLAAR